MRVYAAYPDALSVVERAPDAPDSWITSLSDADALAAAGDRVLVGTDRGVRVSDDAGRPGTFADATGVADPVTALAFGPDGTAWAGTEPSALYRSTDGGRSWTPRPGLTDLPSVER